METHEHEEQLTREEIKILCNRSSKTLSFLPLFVLHLNYLEWSYYCNSSDLIIEELRKHGFNTEIEFTMLSDCVKMVIANKNIEKVNNMEQLTKDEVYRYCHMAILGITNKNVFESHIPGNQSAKYIDSIPLIEEEMKRRGIDVEFETNTLLDKVVIKIKEKQKTEDEQKLEFILNLVDSKRNGIEISTKEEPEPEPEPEPDCYIDTDSINDPEINPYAEKKLRKISDINTELLVEQNKTEQQKLIIKQDKRIRKLESELSQSKSARILSNTRAENILIKQQYAENAKQLQELKENYNKEKMKHERATQHVNKFKKDYLTEFKQAQHYLSETIKLLEENEQLKETIDKTKINVQRKKAVMSSLYGNFGGRTLPYSATSTKIYFDPIENDTEIIKGYFENRFIELTEETKEQGELIEELTRQRDSAEKDLDELRNKTKGRINIQKDFDVLSKEYIELKDEFETKYAKALQEIEIWKKRYNDLNKNYDSLLNDTKFEIEQWETRYNNLNNIYSSTMKEYNDLKFSEPEEKYNQLLESYKSLKERLNENRDWLEEKFLEVKKLTRKFNEKSEQVHTLENDIAFYKEIAKQKECTLQEIIVKAEEVIKRGALWED